MNSDASSLPWEVDVAAVKQRLAGQHPPLLLDCREPKEYALVHIEGALHIPMQQTPARLQELLPYRDGPVVVYCHAGVRSLQVTQWLRQQGFAQVQSMSGGIDAWACLIDPSLPRY